MKAILRYGKQTSRAIRPVVRLIYNGNRRRSQFPTWLTSLRKAARQGDASAQHALALMIYVNIDNGSHVEGTTWFCNAALQGDREARRIVDRMTLQPIDSSGFEARLQERIKNFPCIDANIMKYWLVTDSSDTNRQITGPHDESTLSQLFLETAQEFLGRFEECSVCVVRGRDNGHEEKQHDSEDSFGHSSDHSNDVVIRGLTYDATFREHSNLMSNSFEDWRHELWQSAKNGRFDAQVGLGLLLLKGFQFDEMCSLKQTDSGIGWIRKAAKKGNSYAQYLLGFLLYHGFGAKACKEESRDWIYKACKECGWYSTGNLSLILFDGEVYEEPHYEVAPPFPPPIHSLPPNGRKSANHWVVVYGLESHRRAYYPMKSPNALSRAEEYVKLMTDPDQVQSQSSHFNEDQSVVLCLIKGKHPLMCHVPTGNAAWDKFFDK